MAGRVWRCLFRRVRVLLIGKPYFAVVTCAHIRAASPIPLDHPSTLLLVLSTSSTCLAKVAKQSLVARPLAKPSPNPARPRLACSSRLVVSTVCSRRATTLSVSVPVHLVSIRACLRWRRVLTLCSVPRCCFGVPCSRNSRACW